VTSSQNIAVNGSPINLIQPRTGDAFIRRGLNVAFERTCEGDLQLQDIRVCRPASISPVAGQFAVCANGLHRGFCRTHGRSGDEHTAKSLGHCRCHVVVDDVLASRRHVAADRRGPDLRSGGRIEQRLLDGEGRAEVVRGSGVIECIEREVGRGELPLRQE
jgi:hypothetical protein